MKKSIFYNSVIQCSKKMSNILITLIKDQYWVFQIKGKQGDDNETGLKEGGGTKNDLLTVLSRFRFLLIA